ncbi:MAG: DNA-binding protein [Thermomicrobiales bacterium]
MPGGVDDRDAAIESPDTLNLAAAPPSSAFRLPPHTAHLGNLIILDHPLLALFCSTKCPGRLIIQTYDLARALRDAGVGVISGFHTPMERECLDLLLRGRQPVVLCPARGIQQMRVPPAWKAPLAEGRLLVLSSFDAKHRRPTRDLAAARNAFAASLAARVFIAHAAPGGQTEQFARALVAQGKPVLSFDDPHNANLLALGATPIEATSPSFRTT